MEWRNRRGSAVARPTLTRDGFLKFTAKRHRERVRTLQTGWVNRRVGRWLRVTVPGEGDDELSAHAMGFARKFPIFARSFGLALSLVIKNLEPVDNDSCRT